MKKFNSQINELCKNYHFYSILDELHLKTFGKNIRAAVVAIVKDEKGVRFFKIFYKFDNMRNVRNYGYYKDYAEAYNELRTFLL